MGIIEWLFEKPRRDYFDNISYEEGFESAPSQPKRKDVNIFNLRVGDYVTYQNTDYYVRQRYMYRAGSYNWLAYQFSDSDRSKYMWLDVEEDDEVEINMSVPIKLPEGVTIESLKAKEPVHVNGEQFSYDEHGYAEVKIEKEDNKWVNDTVKYWDYYNQNETKFLSFELWGEGELEAALGNQIKDFELEIYPGS